MLTEIRQHGNQGNVPAIGKLLKQIAANNAAEIDEAFGTEEATPAIDPHHLANLLVGQINFYCRQVDKHMKDNGLPVSEYGKLIEQGEDLKIAPWPLHNFCKDVTPKPGQQVPQMCVLHYRGLRQYDTKRSVIYAPSGNEEDEQKMRWFLNSYEEAQNGGKRTLNAVLAELMDARDRQFACMACRTATQLEDNDSVVFHSDADNYVEVRFTAEMLDVLLGTRESLEDALGITNEDSQEAVCVDTECLVDQLERGVPPEKVRGWLLDRRAIAIHECELEPQKSVRRELRKLVEGISGELLLYDKPEWGCIPPDVKSDAFGLAQGIGVMLRYFDGDFLCALSRDKYPGSRLSCVGQLFLLGLPKGFWDGGRKDYISTCFELADFGQRWFLRSSLGSTYLKGKDSDLLAPLTTALQSISAAQAVLDAAGARDLTLTHEALAGAVWLANVLRPSAVHEGHSQKFTFVVGPPYLRKEVFRDISSLAPINGFVNKDGDAYKDVVTWPKPANEGHALHIENEMLHSAKARIIGNCGVLQGPGTAMFIDSTREKPTIVSIVKPDVPGSQLAQAPDDLGALTKLSPDMFAVRVQGQERMEVYHLGRKLLVWSQHRATWAPEQQWDARTLTSSLSQLLQVGEQGKDVVRTVAEAAVQIAQIPGAGASFALYKGSTQDVHQDLLDMASEMTRPFPGLCNGQLTGNQVVSDSRKLSDAAMQDGGTMVELESGAFLGRRQWVPWIVEDRAGDGRLGRPYIWEHFRVPSMDWLSECVRVETVGYPDIASKACELNFSPDKPHTFPKLADVWRTQFWVRNDQETPTYLTNPLRWVEWYNVISWGTRHIASLGLSACMWDKASVLVVSADGGINLFWRGCAVSSADTDEGNQVVRPAQ